MEMHKSVIVAFNIRMLVALYRITLPLPKPKVDIIKRNFSFFYKV